MHTDDVGTQSILNECLITDTSDLQSLLNDTRYNFYRLNTEARDIVLTNQKLTINRSIFFDLNGRSITFLGGEGTDIEIHNTEEGKTETKTFQTAFYISGGNDKNDVSAFIMDTEGVLLQRAGINVADCSIIVEGNKDKIDTSVNLYLNSGKIHDIRGSSAVPTAINSAAVMVFGNVVDNDTARVARNASFNMYGGYIKSEVGSQWTTGACSYKCIQPRGKGAVVNMVYGDLESFHFCISGQGTPQTDTAKTVDVYGETVINITGGNFVGGKSNSEKVTDSADYCPLFFPQSGEVYITGGNFEGPTCIDAKAGYIEINGGTFNATKTHTGEEVAGQDGPTTDGSVIFAEANHFYTGATLDPLEIYIKNSTMTSKYAYILNCSGNPKSSTITQPDVTFTVDDGTFTYALKGEEENTGYKHDTAAEGHFNPTVNGGTWILKE